MFLKEGIHPKPTKNQVKLTVIDVLELHWMTVACTYDQEQNALHVTAQHFWYSYPVVTDLMLDVSKTCRRIPIKLSPTPRPLDEYISISERSRVSSWMEKITNFARVLNYVR